MIVYRVLPQSLLFKENAISRFPRFCHGGHIRWSVIPRPSNALKHCRNGPIQYHRKKQKKKNLKPVSKRKPELSVEGTKSSQNEWNYNENNRYGKTVDCRVDVISWRERHITASIVINANEQNVWDVLTEYERLAEFIPNLVCSKRIPCPHPDRIWLMQRGVQRALYWHIEAQVVLDLRELPDMVNGKELHFAMVDGDFKQYEGKWSLRPGPRPRTTILYYEVNVKPRFNFPAIFVERIIRKDLPLNLRAVAARAEAKSGTSLKMLPYQKKYPFLSPKTVPPTSNKNSTDNFPATRVPSDSQKVKALYCEMDHLAKYDDVEDNRSTDTLTKLSTININDLSDVSNGWRATGKTCRLDRPCVVDEVHLRRLDDLLENGGVHRSVIATITVNAPSRNVWNVLTTYESLPEFVPNLAISKIISRESNKVRLLQEGCKGLLYMVLHARVVLDLWECPEHEIHFEQVEGDFDSFRGKWVFEQLGNQHTLLKYVVETKMQKNCLLAEAIVEEVIYEDLPSNLSAIRDRVEIKENADMNHSTRCTYEKGLWAQNQYGAEDSNLPIRDGTTKGLNVPGDKPTKQKPKVLGLQQDIDILKFELSKFIAEYGQEGFMPMRKHLRLHGRVDLEKAITRMGGFRNIASLMNLSLAYKDRKPKGYWDSIENLKQEVSQFQRMWGIDPSYMPSRKSFERAGRFDLARAFEKWGGIYKVSRLLMLKGRHPRRSVSDSVKHDRQDFKSRCCTIFQTLNTLPFKAHTPRDSNKRLITLDEQAAATEILIRIIIILYYCTE